MLDLIGNGRPAGDLLSRTVRVTLAGTEYTLPVLTIGGNKRWRQTLDAKLTTLLDGLDADNVGAIYEVLNRQIDDLVDLLVSYDATGVLPTREVIEETVYEDELFAAVREVWRAANPLVAMSVESLTDAPPANGSSAPTSSPPPNGAGRRKRSKKG